MRRRIEPERSMNVVDVIDREQHRIATDLALALDQAEACDARQACQRAVRRIGAYLRGQEHALFPALVAMDDPRVRVPARQHQLLKRRTADVLRHCADLRSSFERQVRKLQQEMLRYRKYEQGELQVVLREVFSRGELHQLGGEMLLHLVGYRRPELTPFDRPMSRTALLLNLFAGRGRRPRAVRKGVPSDQIPVLFDVVGQPGVAS